MKIKPLFNLFALLVILLTTSCNFSPKEEEQATEPANSAQETLQANNLQLTIQVQNVQLTTLAATMVAPPPAQPAQPPAQPPQLQPQATEPTAAPPPGNTEPIVRTTSAETLCWKVNTTNHDGDVILERILAGEVLPILYKQMTRKDETYPWELSAVKVKTARGCTCWVEAGEVEISGDLTNIKNYMDYVWDMNVLFGSCP
jgi:hypothetical protein